MVTPFPNSMSTEWITRPHGERSPISLSFVVMDEAYD